jgi:hypothetical protein
MKIRPVRAELFRADRQTDETVMTDSRSPQFLESVSRHTLNIRVCAECTLQERTAAA